jgi:hypothetical protein
MGPLLAVDKWRRYICNQFIPTFVHCPDQKLLNFCSAPAKIEAPNLFQKSSDDVDLVLLTKSKMVCSMSHSNAQFITLTNFQRRKT